MSGRALSECQEQKVKREAFLHPIWEEYPKINADLFAVRSLMHTQLKVSVPDIQEKIDQYIDAGGKYLRSGLCLIFSAHQNEDRSSVFEKAAALEILHLATLVHDDVIDLSPERRGITTLQVEKSNRIAIYAGDYLLAYAGRLFWKNYVKADFSLTTKYGIEGILRGEIRQELDRYNLHGSFRQYLKRIQGKTALIFGLACASGLDFSVSNLHELKQAFYVGNQIGLAFQLLDDLADFRSMNQSQGKPLLQDVKNGIYTAPILILRDRIGEERLATILPKSRERWTEDQQKELLTLMDEEKVLDRVERLIKLYVLKAKNRTKKAFGEDLVNQLAPLLDRIFSGQ